MLASPEIRAREHGVEPDPGAVRGGAVVGAHRDAHAGVEVAAQRLQAGHAPGAQVGGERAALVVDERRVDGRNDAVFGHLVEHVGLRLHREVGVDDAPAQVGVGVLRPDGVHELREDVDGLLHAQVAGRVDVGLPATVDGRAQLCLAHVVLHPVIPVVGLALDGLPVHERL